MKAVVLTAPRKIEYKDIPSPELKKGEVRVRIKACGICGSDIPRVFRNGARGYPIVLGHEFSGIISEISPEVSGVRVGDHVVGVPLIPCGVCEDCRAGNFSLCAHYSFIGSRQQGAFAEEVVLPAANVVKISKDISFIHAATVEPATVALHGMKLAGFRPGKTAAVLGCGIIGLFAVQLARALGASKVVAVSRGKRGLRAAEKLGADAAVSTLDDDYASRLKALTDGRGFDYVFETSGSDTTMKLVFEAVAKKGTACLIGTPRESLTFEKNLWEQLNRKEFFLTGSWMSYSSPFPGAEWREVIELMRDGAVRVTDDMLDSVWRMSEAEKAFAKFESEAGVHGRIVLIN